MNLTSTKIMHCMADKCIDKKIFDTTQMKLFKLAYFAYTWYGVIYNKKLFNEEPYAWEHGPVFKDARPEMKIYKDDPLTLNDIKYGSNDLTQDVSDFLDKIIAQYGSRSACDLRDLSHNQLWIEKHKTESQLMEYSEIKKFYKNNFIECVNKDFDKNSLTWVITSELIDGLVLEYSDYSLFVSEIDDICLDLIKEYAN
jgi:uncharacterized phage-associated protein